jgi:putative Mg2+ transporter-C (MgtC) family protein
MIIAVGSCLFTIVSAYGFAWSEKADPSRVASIIVQGIGFLGAGALIKGENHVSGLTTAATVWLTAAVGMAAGVGMYVLAVFVTVFALVALVVLQPLSHRLENYGERRKKQREEREKLER